MQCAQIIDEADPRAILSIDDLIMKIGLLVVEKMELERKIVDIDKLREERDYLLAREQSLLQQLNDITIKYNELAEVLNAEKTKVTELERRLNDANNKTKKRN